MGKFNFASIIIALILVVTVVLVIIKLIKDRKSGKGCCSGSCTGCSMKEHCHKDK